MNELSLFSGAGGGLLGSRLLGFRPVGYVEWDDYCQQVIAARVRDGHLPAAPIFGDICQFVESGAAREYRGVANVVSGGFPCQPFSSASRGRANATDRWPDMLNVIRAVRPELVFAENVAGSREVWEHVRCDLEAEGYVCRGPLRLGTSDVGGPDIGTRYWLLATSNGNRESVRAIHEKASKLLTVTANRGCLWWDEAPPASVGMADGMAARLDRLHALGNGQYPALVVRAWWELTA